MISAENKRTMPDKKQQSANDTSQSAETVQLLRRMDVLGGYWDGSRYWGCLNSDLAVINE
jgi:hypothetical protein